MKFGTLLLSAVLLLGGCAMTPKNVMTPMEIQALQTRQFDDTKDVVFPSVMSVFQDLGYTVESADKDTGLIRAQSAANSDASSKFWLGVSKVSQTGATAFIEQIGSTTSVRLNFVVSNQSSYGYGQTDRQDTPVLDAQVYQNAFEKIANAVFVRSAK